MIVQRLSRLIKKVLVKLRDIWDASLSPLRSIAYVKDLKRLKKLSRPNLLLFVHFDKDNRVESYVVDLVRYYQKCFDADVVFISNSSFEAFTESFLEEDVFGFIQRKNVGLDFYAWKKAIDIFKEEMGHTGDLILANDSVYGPIFPGKALYSLDRGSDRPRIVGATDSFEIQYHLQSYLLVFNKPCKQTSEFSDFWKSVKCLGLKHKIVQFYEVGLTQYFLKSGVDIDPIVKYERLRDSCHEEKASYVNSSFDHRKKPMNPTNYFAKELVENFEFPLLKVSYLRDNPYDEFENYKVMENILKKNAGLAENIKKHLKRVGGYSQY